MKLLILTLLAVGSFAYQKEQMLKDNRVASINNDDKVITQWGTTCEECEGLVKRFSEAARDPVKMQELKMLLNVLCHETSYAEECKIFVSKLDVIIAKLEPWLRDSHAVCKKMHMCSNSKLDTFRRIGMLYVKKAGNKLDGMKELVCDECQFAAKELKVLVDDKEKQAEIKSFFSLQICAHLGGYRGMCDLMIEQFLPEMFQELDVILKDTKKACSDIGFCAGVPRKLVGPMAGKDVHEFFVGAKTIMTPKGPILESCFQCKVEVQTAMDGAIEDRVALADDIRKPVCTDLMPSNFTDGCNDFLTLYLPTVLYMTIKQFTPTWICEEMKDCDQMSALRMDQLSKFEQDAQKCEACTGLQTYYSTAMAEPRNHAIFIRAAQGHCDRWGHMAALCDRFVAGAIPRVMLKMADVSKQGLYCRAAHDC